MLSHEWLQLRDGLCMAHELELGRRSDQVIDDYVRVGAATDQLRRALTAELHAGHGCLVE